jgi:hypothetical protein
LTGAGGVAAGDIYVVDGGNPSGGLGNNRIEEFSADGSFVRAWGIDVVASGPDNIDSSSFEVCLPVDVCKAGTQSAAAGGMSKPEGIAIDPETGNVYVADLNSNEFISNSRVDVYSAKGKFEGAFGWRVNASGPLEALQFCTLATGCQAGTRGGGVGQLQKSPSSLPAIDPVDGHLFVPDGGIGGEGNFRIDEFEPELNLAKEVIGAKATGAIGWDVVAGGPDQSDEIQLVKVHATSGKFKLTYKSKATSESKTTEPLLVSASAKEVEEELEKLSSISADGFTVSVSGGPGDVTASSPYKVIFHSTPKGKDAEPLGATGIGLTGGIPSSGVSVETYNDGGKGLEYCVVARGDVCKGGIEADKLGEARNDHLGQFSNGNPTSVAVDESGALYAVNQSANFSVAPGRVYKFEFPAAGEVSGEEFASKELTQTNGDPNGVDPTDVAVGPTNPPSPPSQNVLVAKKEGAEGYKFLEFDSSGALLDESPEDGALDAGSNPNPDFHGLAIGTNERFYFSNPLGEVDIFGPPPPPTAEMLSVTGVGSSTATFNGTVTPAEGAKGEHFPTGYHFEYSADGGSSWARIPKSDLPVGDGSGSGGVETCPTNNPPVCNVHQTAGGLVSSNHYLVRLVASNGSSDTSGALELTTLAGKPTISGEIAEEIKETSAKLCALVNPNNEATSYHFEWGLSTAYGAEAPVPEGPAGSGGKPVQVCVTAAGLSAGSLYHFRLVATNPTGTTNGSDHEFSALTSFGLPDGREPEQVSPSDKRPVGQVAQLLEGQIAFQAASNGEATLYPLQNGLPNSTAGGDLEYLGQRKEPLDWLSTQLTPPSLVPPPAASIGTDRTGRIIWGSKDLDCQIIESFEPLGPLTPELEADVATGATMLYRRNADATYTLLNPLPLSASNGEVFHLDWVSDNCNQVLFDTSYKLLEGAPASGRGLYEWDEGTLRVAGVIPVPGPGEEAIGEAKAGSGSFLTNWDSMSGDGSKAFFTAISKVGADVGKTAIFMRKGGSATVDATQSQTTTPDNGARYQSASADGSQLFFTANYGLAATTSAGASNCSSSGLGCDLYDYDTASGTLSDLSADPNPADKKGAGVVGLLDVSSDGSYAYFAARGQLVAGEGKTETQNLQGNGSFNVYLSHEGSLSFVGLIASADTSENATSGSDIAAAMGHWVADATADGKHLLFVSKANVTGYPSGGVAEAYLYDATAATTLCLSCRADGAPSEGDGETEPIKAQTLESFAAVAVVQNRPHSISNDGSRVFFTMPDVLAPGAKAGARNIYEWSRGQVYLLAAGEGGVKDFTEYADSSADGNDVFVVTKAKLVPQDFDSTTDIYDLRAPHVAGEKVRPPPPPPPPHICEPLADECQGTVTPQPGKAAAPGSEGFSGPGNPPAKKPKKHKHKHKGKKHKKHQAKHAHHRRAATKTGRASR